MLRHLNYANVTATLALFIAIGGSSYAAFQVGSRGIVDNSVRSADVRNNSIRSRDLRNLAIKGRDVRTDALGGEQIREDDLGPVPAAANADRLNGLTIFDLKVRCPSGTAPLAGACMETAARAPAAFPNAFGVCGNESRRLPSYTELKEFQRTNSLASAGEWTSSVYRNPANGSDRSEQLEVVVVVPDIEGVDYRRANTPAPLPYRCVATPSN
jgi:hypothetical protein